MNMEQLQKENDELRANLNLLREAVTPFMNKKHVGVDGALIVPVETYNKWVDAFNKIPDQSIRHIESRVEEETIERCVLIADNDKDGEFIARDIASMPRKYKEQSDV